MTKLQSVLKDHTELTEEEVMNNCPNHFRMEPEADFKTLLIYVVSKKIYGCRGISCEECWNSEVENE